MVMKVAGKMITDSDINDAMVVFDALLEPIIFALPIFIIIMILSILFPLISNLWKPIEKKKITSYPKPDIVKSRLSGLTAGSDCLIENSSNNTISLDDHNKEIKQLKNSLDQQILDSMINTPSLRSKPKIEQLKDSNRLFPYTRKVREEKNLSDEIDNFLEDIEKKTHNKMSPEEPITGLCRSCGCYLRANDSYCMKCGVRV